jgi:hypothetical protein
MQTFMKAFYGSTFLTYLLYNAGVIQMKDFFYVILSLAGCILLGIMLAWGI